MLAEAPTAHDLRAERDRLAGQVSYAGAERTSTPDGALDGQERSPATAEPVVAAPAATVVTTQADGREPRSARRHRFLYRRHRDEDRPLAPAAPGSTVGSDDLG